MSSSTPEEVAGNRDPFAHFLQAGTYRDIDPSPAFNAAAYRKRHLGRPSRQFPPVLMHPDRDNPLVHLLRVRLPLKSEQSPEFVPMPGRAYLASMKLEQTRAAADLAANGCTTLARPGHGDMPRPGGALR